MIKVPSTTVLVFKPDYNTFISNTNTKKAELVKKVY